MILGLTSALKKSCVIPALAAVFMGGPIDPAFGEPINNLKQLGVGAHNSGNDLAQIGLGLHDGSYAAPDGSVHFFFGDGSVRFVSIGPDVQAALCIHNATRTGGIADGTSNTILFSENVGLQFTGGTFGGDGRVRDIVDGTSNTITFPEATNFCFGNVTNLDPVTGPFPGGLTNTITFGDGSSLDLCFTRALLPAVTDGTSNTILFPETRNNVCFNNVVAGPDLAIASTVPEPGTLALVLVPWVMFAGWRRHRVRAR